MLNIRLCSLIWESVRPNAEVSENNNIVVADDDSNGTGFVLCSFLSVTSSLSPLHRINSNFPSPDCLSIPTVFPFNTPQVNVFHEICKHIRHWDKKYLQLWIVWIYTFVFFLTWPFLMLLNTRTFLGGSNGFHRFWYNAINNGIEQNLTSDDI